MRTTATRAAYHARTATYEARCRRILEVLASHGTMSTADVTRATGQSVDRVVGALERLSRDGAVRQVGSGSRVRTWEATGAAWPGRVRGSQEAPPTPTEIQQQCEAIRAQWDEDRIRQEEHYIPACIHGVDRARVVRRKGQWDA